MKKDVEGSNNSARDARAQAMNIGTDMINVMVDFHVVIACMSVWVPACKLACLNGTSRAGMVW